MAAIGVIRDITERKRQEEELRRYARQLEEATRIKDLFADILRHDLLGPAATLQMSVEMLLKQGPDSPSAARLLAGAKRSCAKLTDMIEAAATYAKISAASDIEFGTVDLGPLLKRLPAEFELALAERNARLTIDAPGVYPARANEMVSEVFANLLSNADQVRPHRRRDRDRCVGRRRSLARLFRRLRRGDRVRRQGARVHALRARGEGRREGHRAGPRDCAPDRGTARRPDLDRGQPARRRGVLRRAPEGLGQAGLG
jgi:hypothetical protein